MVPDANTGLKVPVLRAMFERLASVDCLVTVRVYVLVVVPSSAVTTVVMVLAPTDSAILPEATPLATVAPLTVILA